MPLIVATMFMHNMEQTAPDRRILEVDQCFVSTDPNINPDEFFKIAEQQLLERIRKRIY